MQELIKIWLNGPQDYQLGVEIYNRFGDNSFLKNMFAEGEDDYNSERLLEELKKLYTETDEVIKPQIVAKTIQEIPKRSEQKDAPVEVTEAIKQRKQLYFEARDAHSQLKALRNINDDETKEKRRQKAALILGNFDAIKPLWDLTNHYDEFGKLPEAKVITEEKKEYSMMSEKDLNALWEKNYKYAQKWKNDISKTEQLKARIEENNKIKTVLGDAFLYTKHRMPTISA